MHAALGVEADGLQRACRIGIHVNSGPCGRDAQLGRVRRGVAAVLHLERLAIEPRAGHAVLGRGGSGAGPSPDLVPGLARIEAVPVARCGRSIRKPVDHACRLDRRHGARECRVGLDVGAQGINLAQQGRQPALHDGRVLDGEHGSDALPQRLKVLGQRLHQGVAPGSLQASPVALPVCQRGIITARAARAARAAVVGRRLGIFRIWRFVQLDPQLFAHLFTRGAVAGSGERDDA